MDEPTSNPAVERQLTLPPTLLAALDTDPDAMLPHYRKMTAIQASNLHMLAKSPAVPIGQKVQILELFAKLSGADKKANQQNIQASSLPSISIVFNSAPAKSMDITAAPQVVDVKATEVEAQTPNE